MVVLVKSSTARVVSLMAPNAEVLSKMFRYSVPVDQLDTVKSIVVVVEDLETGVWGSTRLKID